MITTEQLNDEITALAKSALEETGAIKEIRKKIKSDTANLEETQNEIDNLNLDTIDNGEDICAAVRDLIDSHAWVIYYNNAWEVARLLASDNNACAEFEEIGYIQRGKTLDDLICQFAYCALYGNVIAELDNTLDRLKEQLNEELEGAKK